MDFGISLIILTILFFIGLLPYWIARARSHPQKAAILVMIIFLGWTGFGWAAAMVWAFWNYEKQ